jgi:hypothetical protein
MAFDLYSWNVQSLFVSIRSHAEANLLDNRLFTLYVKLNGLDEPGVLGVREKVIRVVGRKADVEIMYCSDHEYYLPAFLQH